MYKGQHCIAILTDRSYFIRDIGIPMNESFALIQNSFKDTYFVYGMNDMIDLEIEGYLNVFKVPDDHRLKFQYDKSITSAIAISRQFLNILQYTPDRVILFRDNPQSTDTSVFVLECVKRGIPITAIDDFANKTDLNAEIMNRRVYNTLTIGKGVRHP